MINCPKVTGVSLKEHKLENRISLALLKQAHNILSRHTLIFVTFTEGKLQTGNGNDIIVTSSLTYNYIQYICISSSSIPDEP